MSTIDQRTKEDVRHSTPDANNSAAPNAGSAHAPSTQGVAEVASTNYFPSPEVAIGTLLRSFIVDGVLRDHFPTLSIATTAARRAGDEGGHHAEPEDSNLCTPIVNSDGSTSHPPVSDSLRLPEADQLAAQAIARDLLQSLRQPADVALYTRCSGYPNAKRRLLCSPDLTPEQIRSTVPQQYLALFAVDVPAISLTAFTIRLVQRMHCGMDAFIWAIALLFRVSSKIPVCSRSVHRMLLAATLISAKCRNDIYYSMTFYAGVGGVARGDLRAMEVAMLTALDFTAYITPRVYVDLLYSMRQHCAQLTHTFKKQWASEAWASFIVAVPLAHSAAFEPQAVLAPPTTPRHLKRENIVMPQRTKGSHRDKTQEPVPLPPSGGTATQNITDSTKNNSTDGSAADVGEHATVMVVPTGDSKPHTIKEQTVHPSDPAQPPNGMVKNGYAYYAVTGDDSSPAGNKHSTHHIQTMSSSSCPPAALQAASISSNSTSQQPLNTLLSSNPAAIADLEADARSVNSSLHSFTGVTGPLSNSGASVDNMRIVGMGAVRPAVDSTNPQHTIQYYTHPSGAQVGTATGAAPPHPQHFMSAHSRRYVPSANTSMNSFSDRDTDTDSCQSGGVRGKPPAPRIVSVPSNQPFVNQQQAWQPAQGAYYQHPMSAHGVPTGGDATTIQYYQHPQGGAPYAAQPALQQPPLVFGQHAHLHPSFGNPQRQGMHPSMQQLNHHGAY